MTTPARVEEIRQLVEKMAQQGIHSPAQAEQERDTLRVEVERLKVNRGWAA